MFLQIHTRFIQCFPSCSSSDSSATWQEVGHTPRRWKLRARDIRHTLRLAGIKNAATRTSFIPFFLLSAPPFPDSFSTLICAPDENGLPAEFIEKMAMRMKWHALIRWIRDRCGSLFPRRHGQHLATSRPTRKYFMPGNNPRLTVPIAWDCRWAGNRQKLTRCRI